MISQGAIAHQISWLARSQGLVSGARILFKTPASFDAAQWEILANAAGATIVAAPTGSHRDPELVCELITRHRVSLLQCVPTLWRALVELPGLSAATSLRHVFSGGDVLSTKLASAILEALPNARLVNLYGPTETTINATWQEVGSDQLWVDAAVSIGAPVPGCCIHVLDQQLVPVPSGTVGELCIGGEQVGLGYCNRPELTSQRFVAVTINGHQHRVYRTGDLAAVTDDGTVNFHGRLDNQVKVNGHRVETEEVRLAIEEHDWVNAAAVVPWADPDDRLTRLGAFVELDASEAALMDEDRAGEHHRSKRDHAQAKAQLARLATRFFRPGCTHQIALPGRDGRAKQRRVAFARKTYRFFDGPPLSKADLVQLAELLTVARPARERCLANRGHVADLLRWLGPFHSEDRLLPKYAYASPGALNATQAYLEIAAIADLPDGYFYYDPHEHRLSRLGSAGNDIRPGEVRVHLVGLPRAIKSVYSTNVWEVLHLEAGHIAGLLDLAAGEQGAHLIPLDPVTAPPTGLGEDHVHTASYTIALGEAPPTPSLASLHIQVHGKIVDLRQGTYKVVDGALHHVSDSFIERRDVIAINQESYARSDFGVIISCPRGTGWPGLVELGRGLQRLQMNDKRIGLMSSGYASLSGRDLRAASRFDQIIAACGTGSRLSYFAIGGSITAEQVASTGMKEDAVHMMGPAELLKADLRRSLPHHMVPARVELVAALPLSGSGKVDRAELTRRLQAPQQRRERVAPRSSLETAVADVWEGVLACGGASMTDDFFEVGGDSLIAVRLVSELNHRLETSLPVQAVFEAPTIADLAGSIEAARRTEPHTRRVRSRCEYQGFSCSRHTTTKLTGKSPEVPVSAAELRYRDVSPDWWASCGIRKNQEARG
jgi:acyl-CoA synthetase (AMP-forming)/AMP-acid ligase II/acyl carrier protein